MTVHAIIEEKAAAWLSRMADDDWCEDEARAFDAWISESWEHAAAFWRLEHGFAQLDRLRSLPEQAVTAERQPFWSKPRLQMRLAMAATILALFFAGTSLLVNWLAMTAPEATAYSTKIGQISEIAMVDGSQISLDSDSAVRVGTGPDARQVWIDRGRAFFEVTHDGDRPFRVHAGEAEITVLGTKFVVGRSDSRVTTTVLEGKVRLQPDARESATGLTLTRGQAAIADGRALRPLPMDVGQIQDSLAWREGMVIFKDTPIEQALAEFNRYNQRKLVLRTQTAGDMRIGGKFRLGNVEGFARLMDEAYGLQIEMLPAPTETRAAHPR
jgi:transmembrane sensor